MNLANRISFCRIILIPIFIVLVLYYTPEKEYFRFWAAAVFIFSTLSDAIDGYIARKKKQITKLGSFLDPIADKLLLNTAFILLFLRKDLSSSFLLPIWIPLVVLTRDIIIVIGSLSIYLVNGSLEIKSRPLGKLSTFFQTLSIIFIILHFPFTALVCYLTGIFTIASGIDYMWRGTRLLSPPQTQEDIVC